MIGPYSGSCLCGAVKFEVDEFLPLVGHCHCSMCRKFHGAEYATLADVSVSRFRWIRGEEAIKSYVAENGTERGFCVHCGSSLTFSSPNAPKDIIEIALGAFDDEIPVTPDAHIFVASGANWACLNDDLPKFEAGRDSARVDQ